MYECLDAVWDEVQRFLRPGGIAGINVGDATRSVDGKFRRYPNHERVLRAFRERGLRPLPDALWRKPTNRVTTFMGSGMLPPNDRVPGSPKRPRVIGWSATDPSPKIDANPGISRNTKPTITISESPPDRS
ncbi:MAG: hypothetical protein ACI9PP_001946, partial [Halobacteriales archaeon]